MDEERKVIYSEPGSPIKPVYSAKLTDDGMIELVQTGEENIQEYIDSFAEETCLSVLIQRCAAGDLSGLSKVQGMYGDFLDAPKTYRDMLQAVIDGQAAFDKLPVEVKKRFDNSFEKWFSTMGEKSWLTAMEMISDEKVEEEVKTE